MQFSLDIAERVRLPRPLRRVLVPIFQATIERAWKDVHMSQATLFLSVACVSPEEIRVLNRKYLQHDRSTDVLSFPEYSAEELHVIREKLLTSNSETIFLGEIVLCYDEIVHAAQEDDVSDIHELAFIFSHGILHLLGFLHGERMFVMQDDVADEITKAH